MGSAPSRIHRASSGGNVQPPGDPPLKRRQLYLLKFEPQTEMFSLRTIKAASNRLFLETEIPLQESDGVYRPAACGRHAGSGIALRSPGPPRRPRARCGSGGPRPREAAPRGGLSTAAEAGPGYPDPYASPQTPKHPSHNSKPRLRPRSGKGHLSEPVLYRPGPPRGSGVRGGGSPSTRAAPPPEGRSRARCDLRSASPRAGLDGSCGRGGGPVRKQRCRAREDGADRTPAREARPCSPEALVGRLCLERTETLEQRSSRRHAVREGSGLVRVLLGRHSGTPVPSSSSSGRKSSTRHAALRGWTLACGLLWGRGWWETSRRGPAFPAFQGAARGWRLQSSKWVTPQRQS